MQLFTLFLKSLSRMKPLLAIVFLTIIYNTAFAQQSTKMRSDEVILADFKKANANKTETQLKQSQAKIMKELCPNHPSYKTAVTQPGANVQSINAYESWKKNYPAEYAAYLKIFDFKY